MLMVAEGVCGWKDCNTKIKSLVYVHTWWGMSRIDLGYLSLLPVYDTTTTTQKKGGGTKKQASD